MPNKFYMDRSQHNPISAQSNLSTGPRTTREQYCQTSPIFPNLDVAKGLGWAHLLNGLDTTNSHPTRFYVSEAPNPHPPQVVSTGHTLINLQWLLRVGLTRVTCIHLVDQLTPTIIPNLTQTAL